MNTINRLKSWLSQRVYPLLGILFFFASLTFTAHALLTVSSTGLSSDSNTTLDGAGLVSVGAASSTGVSIGRTGQIVTFPGNVAITGNSTSTGNFTVLGSLFDAGGNRYSTSTASGATSTDSVTYTAPFASSTSRTLTSKLTDVISVKDFGAKGDGSTNDASAIQAALNAVSSGGTVYFPPGTYMVGTTLTESTAGVTIDCANPSSVTIEPVNSFNSTVLKIGWAGAQRQGMNLTNCGFNGNNGGNATGTLVWYRDVANSTIENNYMKFAKTNALVMDASVSGTVDDNVLNNIMFECGEQCFVINEAGSDATDFIVDGNHIGGSAIGDGTQPWVSINTIGSLQFTNNHISGPGHTDGFDATNTSQQHLFFDHNQDETINDYGMEYAGRMGTISNNHFYEVGTAASNTYSAMNMLGSNNDSIVDNIVDGNSITKNAIWSSSGIQNLIIDGNTFLDLTGVAINFQNAYAGNNKVGVNQYFNDGGTITDNATSEGGNTQAMMGVTKATTGDVTNSTVSAASVTGLSWNIAASTNYYLNCNLIYTASSTGGLVLSFTGPASPTYVSYSLNEGLSATSSSMTATTGTSFTTTLGTAVTTVSTPFPAYFAGTIQNGSTAGTLQLKFQSAAAVSTTIKQGSWCTLQQVN